MHPRTRTTNPVQRPLLAAALAGWLAGVGLSAWAQAPEPPPRQAHSLKELFDAAWARQPEAQALDARRHAARAHRRAAEAWTPQPPAVEASHRTDRITGNEGARELELGIAVPLWLPHERRGTAALADAELAATDSRAAAARLRLAALVREAWWAWQRALVDVDMARVQLAAAGQIASDVSRRTQAGELARADQHQADGAVAAAQAVLAEREAAGTAALLQLKALTGAALAEAPAAVAEPAPPSAMATTPAGSDATLHPALAEWQDRATLAERAAALAATQSRANPELTLSTQRERGSAGEGYGHTLMLALRVPFGGGSRHEARVTSARADAIEAQAQLALERDRLVSVREAAAARVDAARAQLAAAERRALLARETRGFFEKSFRLGETDLPTRLRVEADAIEAERQALRNRIELGAAISAWRQALGLLPQ